jgi:isopenicillin-N epimerase
MTSLLANGRGGGSAFQVHWGLDPDVAFLNHGSFGACPVAVLDAQRRLRDRMERQPVQFLARDLEVLLDAARADLAAFVGADPDDVAFVPNATTGVNTVLRSLRYEPGDELLTTDHVYNACRNAMSWAEGQGARVTIARVPFPLASSEEVVEAILSRVNPRTRLALVDHVTSPTGLVYPIERIVKELLARGVDALVDGAHAPGMVPIDVTALGAAYYTGNCHKWLCAPKGAAFLHVRRDRQAGLRPNVISHGANSVRTDRSRFRLEFDWAGTDDPTAFLCVPASIKFLSSLLPGGFPELMQRNRALALHARRLVCDAAGVKAPAPDDMIGTLAAVPLPPGPPAKEPLPPGFADPLHVELVKRGIEAPVWAFPAAPQRLIRVSAQLYNAPAQYERLAAALRELLPG